MAILADKAILSGADKRPPMLEKDMYDSWKSIMKIYMMNRQHGRTILESVENGLLIWPTIEENGVTRPKKYSELSVIEAIQADCDIKATNIILQGLPPEVYALVNNHKVAKELWERIQLLIPSDDSNDSPYQSQQYSNNQSSTPLSITYPSNDYQSSVHHNVYSPSSSIPQFEYAPTVMPSSEQSNVVNHSKTEITSDSNIIPYSQYVIESQQTVVFYDHTTKQALDFQNPFYLKKAQQLEPKLYDSNVIEKTNAIVIPDSKRPLMHLLREDVQNS
ncbi:hypothetical protein Tco_0895396 [Tanacetum coccineum]|uniref:Integrase, catalytic region, zinc finger, CCHC-type, peptidase aspartic, catalytic n=1 Tax=Tanacetum coccineum TaxID=301880 RepID=A0ABQ5CFP3_9ASTR